MINSLPPIQSTLFDTTQFVGLKRKIADSRLPTNTTTNGHAIHRWFNFIAGFSPEFVALCCQDLQDGEMHTLLDPFGGCGTSLVAARQLGLNAIGFEPHPIFGRLATAKSRDPALPDEIDAIEAIMQAGFRKPVEISSLPESPVAFLSKLVPAESLARLLGARSALERSEFATNPVAFLILSKLLDKCSSSQTDGIYKAPTSLKRGAILDTAFNDILLMIREDIAHCSVHFANTTCRLFPVSSQRMPAVADGSVSVIVTSPPYLNNFDYAEMTRMYLYFWGLANSWGEITDTVRSKLIVNTTTALRGHKLKQAVYRDSLSPEMRDALDDLVQALADKRKTKAGKKEYDLLIYPYFAQMLEALRECFRVLARGRKLQMMIADAALYGIHIATPQILAQMMEEIGFEKVTVALVRERGHRWILEKREGSATGLGEYQITATK